MDEHPAPEGVVADRLTATANTLPPLERTVFSLLGLHPAPARIGAEEAAALSGLDPGEAAGALGVLAQAHLLAPAEGGVWRMHDAVAAVADRAARALGTGAARAATARLVHHAVAAATAADAAANPARSWRLCTPESEVPEPLPVTTTAEALDWFEAREPLLHGLLQLAHEAGMHKEVCALAEALRTWIHARRPLRVWLRACELGAASAQLLGAPGPRAAMALLDHSRLMSQLRYSEAAQAARTALGHAEQAGNPLAEGSAWQSLGSANRKLGNLRAAVCCCERAVELYEQAGHARGAAVQRRFLGMALVADGRPAEALAAYSRALEVLEQAGDTVQAAHALIASAEVLTDLDRPEEAAAAAARALETALQAGHGPQAVRAHRVLARAAQVRGDLEAARTHLHTALEQARWTTPHQVGDLVNRLDRLDRHG
ncbi:tetratricopeptide repeat protein [Nocardiopsis sp. CNT-189]|uniref:tetratricopeptide repeat protein n=1 Tax=Nocardiopsis oceanisediminis TaxID=2816862 RepID=UPI003B2EA052